MKKFLVGLILLFLVSPVFAQATNSESVSGYSYDYYTYTDFYVNSSSDGTNSAYIYHYSYYYGAYFYCHGSADAISVKIKGKLDSAKATFNTDDLDCYGYSPGGVSISCAFDDESYTHTVGNTTQIYNGAKSNYHSNVKSASADCTIDVAGGSIDTPYSSMTKTQNTN